MVRERSFPEGIRRDGKEAPSFSADEVIYERDPLGQDEVPAIDEVVRGEPAPESSETS